MKRNHNEEILNKNKRFSYPNDNRAPPPPTHSPGSYYAYQTPLSWADAKGHANISMYPPQNMMMPWNSASGQAPPPPQSTFSPIYNPLQPPPPPLPLDRPPIDAPPPPPPHGQGIQRRNLNSMINMNNMRRRPQNSQLRPDQAG